MRFPPMTTRRRLFAVTAVAVSTCVCGSTGVCRAEGETIAMPGRVVAREGDRPVAGAEVVVRIGEAEETMRTDADGRFTVRIPSGPGPDPAARLSVSVRHPDF